MRNTRKILVALLVLMSILMSLAVVAIPASAAAPEKLDLTPSANWKQSNARFAAYFFGNGEKWVSMTDSDKDGVYEVAVPAGYPNVIFCRMDPGKTANDWNSKWNQTADLTIPTSGANHYTVKEGTWDKGGGTWSTFGSTCAHANLGPAATCTTSQDCLDCKDPIVSALGHTYNSAHLCTRCNEQATFTVAGSGAHLGTEWDTGNKANDMTYADGVYTKVYENVAAGSYLLKVARDHDWGTAYPSADKAYTVATAGSTVTVTLKGTTVNVTVEVPHVHSWSDATCTELSKCECGETQGELAAHNYVEGVCSVCGACEHEFEENIFFHPELVAADCCHTGVAVFECTKCDYYYTEETPIDPEAHAFWGDREVITEANCATKTNGLEKVACDNGCGQFDEVEVLYSEAHNWDVQKEVFATCTVDGEYYAVCTICNEVESYSSEAQGHYNWYVTCGQTGNCMECGEEFTAAPHTVDPCEGGFCDNCYEMIEGHHDFVEGKCSVCGAEDPEYAPPAEKEEHTFTADLVAVPNADKDAIADGTIYADYFTVVGKVTVRWTESKGVYAIELDKKSNGALQFTVAGKSTITVSFASTGSSNLSLIGLVDAEGNFINPTEGVEEVTGTGFITVTYTVGEGTYKVVNPSSDRNTRVESVVVAPAVEAPAHVNTLVVGETNKIVVSGNTLNAAGAPIEWVEFVVTEKAHYEFIGDNGALAYIFDANFGLISATGAADLEAGAYWICLGNGSVGEFNVAVTKTAIEEPVAPQYNWWVSNDSYTVEGDNIKYNGAGNTYACVGCDVTELAAGNNTFTITITNNGSAIAKVRVDLQATVQVGNHKVVNVSAVGGDVWTDSDWGGSHVHVAPGESVTLVITYDENTERGAVKDLIIFADSSRGDEAVYSADITVSGMAFSKVSDDEPVDYTNTLVVGDNNVVIGHKAVDNGYGYLMETVIFTADEKAHYKFAGAGLTVLVYDMAFNNLCAFTGEADLDAGMYIICFAANTIGTTGEYSLSVTKSAISDEPVVEPELPAIVLGDNAVVIDGTQTNLVGNAIAWYTFTPEVAGAYQFASADLTVYILTSKNMADANAYVGAGGIAELEAGVKYFILVGKDGVTGEFTVNVATYEGEKPHVNTMVVGDNKYIISDALLGIEYEFLAVEITEPGTYVITGGAPMQVYFFTVPGTLDDTAPFQINIDSVTLEFLTSFEVTLAEAGTYWIGFRYDYVGDEREFDINISLKPASEQPDETPDEQPEQPDEQPEQPAPELSLFEKIMQTINEFIAKITAWFKSFIAGLKK